MNIDTGKISIDLVVGDLKRLQGDMIALLKEADGNYQRKTDPFERGLEAGEAIGLRSAILRLELEIRNLEGFKGFDESEFLK